MGKYELIAPCNFGLEAVLKREIQQLGYEIVQVQDGRVIFAGDEAAICRANIFLRTAERVMIKMARFHASDYDELFDGILDIPWEEFIPQNGKFGVAKASPIRSELTHIPAIQSIGKKAMATRLCSKYRVDWCEEKGPYYPVRINILNDIATIALDTTGETLHKRGYRQDSVKAPLKETLAAGLILLTPWNKDRILVDPFCGSGTIPIEAAMIGANIAPGMYRSFLAEEWKNFIDKKRWYDAINEAEDLILRDVKMDIEGYDIDPEAVKAAKKNARAAEVDHLIHFQQRPVSQLSHSEQYGFIVTNPPYGRRLNSYNDLSILYEEIGKTFSKLDSWSYYIITTFEQAEQHIGRKSDRNRKIYNGMLKTYYYQYTGPKPLQKTDNPISN